MHPIVWINGFVIAVGCIVAFAYVIAWREVRREKKKGYR
jgi:predicted negative regulator of RcsB-dependent stress response